MALLKSNCINTNRKDYMTKKTYIPSYFFDGIDEATLKFHACYEDIKTLLDKSEEQSPEANQLIRDEIAFYLANFLYLYHRDAFSKDKE